MPVKVPSHKQGEDYTVILCCILGDTSGKDIDINISLFSFLATMVCSFNLLKKGRILLPLASVIETR